MYEPQILDWDTDKFSGLLKITKFSIIPENVYNDLMWFSDNNVYTENKAKKLHNILCNLNNFNDLAYNIE